MKQPLFLKGGRVYKYLGALHLAALRNFHHIFQPDNLQITFLLIEHSQPPNLQIIKFSNLQIF
jgi:hypothetical protein